MGCNLPPFKLFKNCDTETKIAMNSIWLFFYKVKVVNLFKYGRLVPGNTCYKTLVVVGNVFKRIDGGKYAVSDQHLHHEVLLNDLFFNFPAGDDTAAADLFAEYDVFEFGFYLRK